MSKGIRYILWGSAGHAKVLNDIITLLGGKVIALFDNDSQAVSAIAGVPLHVGQDGFLDWFGSEVNVHDVRGFAAIGGSRGRDRLAIHALFRAYGVRVETLVHPHASVCSTARLGAGTQVLAQGLVAAESVLGEGCIVNHGASVDHECVLGQGVHLAPGATLCGCVNLADYVMIGAGAVVLPRITVGESTVVGAGAVVTRDFGPNVVVAGNPARIIKHI